MGEEILLKAQSKLRVLGSNFPASLKWRWEGKNRMN